MNRSSEREWMERKKKRETGKFKFLVNQRKIYTWHGHKIVEICKEEKKKSNDY